MHFEYKKTCLKCNKSFLLAGLYSNGSNHCSEIHFEASSGTFLVSKSKNVFFPPENAILELILAFCGDFTQNTPPWTEKMCSEACKVKKHTQSIPNSKGLRQNITKMIIGNFLQKSKFYIFSKISILENVDFTAHFQQKMRVENHEK